MLGHIDRGKDESRLAIIGQETIVCKGKKEEEVGDALLELKGAPVYEQREGRWVLGCKTPRHLHRHIRMGKEGEGKEREEEAEDVKMGLGRCSGILTERRESLAYNRTLNHCT